MPEVKVGNLTFRFPSGWKVSPFDTWSYYRNQFQNVANNVRLVCGKCDVELRCKACGTRKTAGIKASDLLAVAGPDTWLIEVKDYRQHPRTKVIDVADEIALKIRDSLAVLLAAAVNANVAGEKSLAQQALKCSRLRIVLHLEQPTKPSKLFPRVIDRADVLQCLKQLVKCIDPTRSWLKRMTCTTFPGP